MDKLGSLDMDNGEGGCGSGGGAGGSSDSSSAEQDARRQTIQHCIASLLHASQCRDANCRLPACHKMKRVMAHTKQCRRRATATCPICKQLIALCCYHAKRCMEGKCQVPFCIGIKQRLRMQQMQQRMLQTQMMNRRMAYMQQGRGGAGSLPSSQGSINASQFTDQVGGSGGTPELVSPRFALELQQSLCAKPVMHPGAVAGGGLTPAPPLSAQLIASQIKQSAELQARESVGSLVPDQLAKRNIIASFQQQQDLMQRRQQQQQQLAALQQQDMFIKQEQCGGDVPNGGQQGLVPQAMNSASVSFVSTGGEMMDTGGMDIGGVSTSMMDTGGVSTSMMDIGGVSTSMTAASNAAAAGVARSNNQKVLLRLLAMLRAPTSPEHHKEVLNILKSNPMLMAMFLKQVSHACLCACLYMLVCVCVLEPCADHVLSAVARRVTWVGGVPT